MHQMENYKELIERSKGIGIMPEIVARRDDNKTKLRILRLNNNMRVRLDAIFLKQLPPYKPAEKFANLVKIAFNNDHKVNLN